MFCDTLEDRWRDLNVECKVPDETCIPAGRYRVVWDMSHRFARKMLHVLDVPRFTGIRVHAGNRRKDTSGCILVGKYLQEGVIYDSRKTIESLEKVVTAAIDRGEEVWLTIEDAK